ncbi:putative bifunctional diguanylate cyclase/phosphodiesterase [Limimaricola hongkongensis]|uniref:Diguanylate cyclase/phosphodiesterase (GGDEF & EAL domain) with PAS/PAC sensor(S) n=1 Tax=Limimaricola hongkongensis DSM 17492 TaxID=1122180 RepID=A0A017HAU4_9RHOB|nr:EAL domain-containing protein [Limimaricola hongkongensis]EYD70909.1 diguanylate cyclase/phosphodiesterase (GGDEF & EAL domain) with PAS/PAC sensor(s) [Limimaricola hongkongensis DSM 17492]
MIFGITSNVFHSLRFRVLAALMLGLGLSFGLMILHLSSTKLDAVTELAETASRHQTMLAAGQARAGIETRDEAYLENIYFDLVFGRETDEGDSPRVQTLRVIDRDGRRLKSYETLEGPHVAPGRIEKMAGLAMEGGAVQQHHQGDLLVVSAPVFDQMGREVIGAISIAWDHGHLHDSVVNATLKSAFIGLAAALAMMLAIGSVMQRLVLRPIGRLARAVERIQESGDLSRMPSAVLDRRDEIGSLANRFQSLLSQSNAQIMTRRKQLDTALECMAQGLCLFDGAHRLVMSNPRVEEIYGLPEGALRPGMHIRAVLEACRDAGSYPASRIADIEKTLVRPARSRRPLTYLETLGNGTIIAVVRVPMPDGGWVATFEDVTERKRTEAKVEHMALHDALTGLPNRLSFRGKLEEALRQTGRDQQLAVLCLDLDHFKAVNDTLGHPVGDALLKQVGQRLQRNLRQSSVVARLSGDEFAIVEKNVATVAQTGQLAERLVHALSEPFEIDGHHIVIGSCIGIALAPTDGTDANRLVKAADLALYRAKSEGRGTYRFFEAGMDARMQERRALELDLRAAFAREELELHYQPIVNLETGTVSCFEALLRWTHESRGAVSPAEFVPLAEEIGLITQLGAWVLREACQMAAQWPGDVRVAVNLSPVQFRSLALITEVETALEASGLAPGRLELEITETVLLRQTELTLSILQRLRMLGVRISMDDFGTGYSSLSYLRTFPFDKIKIDRSFIKDVVHHGDAEAIVRAISSMGASLGMVTTAEGVETLDQLEKLRREGCTEVQGYYFSPAVHVDEVLTLLGRIGAATAPEPRLPCPAHAGTDQPQFLPEIRHALP